MFLKKQKMFASLSGRKNFKWAGLLISTFTLVSLCGALEQKPALASDLDGVQIAAQNDSHFVRLWLNKSIVIRLPADAQDGWLT